MQARVEQTIERQDQPKRSACDASIGSLLLVINLYMQISFIEKIVIFKIQFISMSFFIKVF